MQEFKKIAIIKLSAIGDVVHALPVASALRERYPDAHLAWIVQGKCREILEGNPDLDEVIIFDKDRWLLDLPYPHKTASILWEMYRFGSRLRRAGFDLAIDLQGLIKSGVLTWLTGAGTRIGFSADYCREPANARFTNCHVTPLAGDVHIIDQCLSLVRGLGADTSRKQFKIHIPDEDHAYISKFLENKQGHKQGHKQGQMSNDAHHSSDECHSYSSDECHSSGACHSSDTFNSSNSSKVPKNTRIVLINPGAGWETKLWGEENYAALADRIVSELGNRGWRVVFLWGPSELSMVKSIQKKMRQPSLLACPTNLKQSLALMQRAHLFVAGDTGPLHMAAALGTPCLGIYGPSSPERNGPYGDRHRVVQTDVPCKGCFRRFCSHALCMESISVDQVMEAIRTMLPKSPSASTWGDPKK
jgi:lipopolysaccharide heptosyltransferase I